MEENLNLFLESCKADIRLSNSHGLTVRLTVWDAISRSHGFAFKSRGDPEHLEIAKKIPPSMKENRIICSQQPN